MGSLRKIFGDIFTGPDGQSVEVAHVLWVLAVLVFLAITIYVVLKTGQYPNNFGTDFLTLNGGGAAGAFARAKADQAETK